MIPSGLPSCNVMNWIKRVLWLVKMKQVLCYYHCTILSQGAKRASDWGCQNTYCPGRGREQSTGRSLPWKGHGHISIPHRLRLQWGSSLCKMEKFKVCSMENVDRSKYRRVMLGLLCYYFVMKITYSLSFRDYESYRTGLFVLASLNNGFLQIDDVLKLLVLFVGPRPGGKQWDTDVPSCFLVRNQRTFIL